MVFVTVSETYDLSTKANKMTLIGVHTPGRSIIQKTYPGLCMNSRFCRVVKQDVVLACASMMPFSADIIGTGAGDISPEDAFNPILFKAVSNDSMSTLEARMLGMQNQSVDVPLQGSSVYAENDDVTGLDDEFGVYYALLSNRDGFRTANPQQGLSMKGLVPLVFEKYYNYGENYTLANDNVPVETVAGANQDHTVAYVTARGMRGRPHPMPKFNTTYLTSVSRSTSAINGMGDGTPANAQAQMPDILPCYTACIIMPPSRLHALYYRLVVRTTLEFTGIRPIQEIASFAALDSDYSSMVYHTDYADQSKLMDVKEGMVDVKDGEINKIMEGS